MKSLTLIFTAMLAHTLASVMPAHAHHSRSLFFDDEEGGLITIEGIISNVKWVNPHLTFTIDVTRQDGGVEQWEIVSRPASFLHRRGWNATTLEAGDNIILSGWKGRSERLNAWLREMIVYGPTEVRFYVEFTDEPIKTAVAALGLPGCAPITADCVKLDASTLTTLQQEFGEQLPILFGRVQELLAR